MIQPPDYTQKTPRQFTDREEPQQHFLDALTNINQQDYSILAFYGVGGIGKSRLQRHLKTAHLDKDDNCLYSSVDFDTAQNRAPHYALRTLVRNFKQQKPKISFLSFELAYLIYWNKAFPDQELKKSSLPFLEEGGLVSDGIAVANEAGGVVSIALRAVDYVFKKSKEFTFDSEVENRLDALKPLLAEQIEEQLAWFFANDIKRFIDENRARHNEKKIIIFLDTYEALWEGNRKEYNRLSQDAWIRDLIATLTYVNTLFVICGREKLVWEEDDVNGAAWKEYLSQYDIGNFTDDDARDFLQSCGIADSEIQARIIEDSECVPYYLDLSVDIFERIKRSGKTPNAANFKVVGKQALFTRFMKYLDREEAATLKVLSNARFYTRDLMGQLIEKFKTSYPITEIDQLNAFSFIREEDGQYQIHDLMRRSLRDFQSEEQKQEVNQFLFEYYNQVLEGLTVKTIAEESLQALPEAFYHKQQLGEIEGLMAWFDPVYNLFMDAAKYHDLMEITQKLSEQIEQEFGEENIVAGSVWQYLADLYREQGKYEEAEPLYQRSLLIKEKVLGIYHTEVATTLNNLALLHDLQGKYEEAEPLYQRSLSIRENVLEKDHPEVATTLNNLAELYRVQDKYEEAEPLYQRSLLIMEKSLGEDHPHVASASNNLALLYESQSKYEEAEPLYQRSLLIKEKALGKDHPSVATTLNNLAGLYEAQRKYEEAEPLYQRSLLILEKVLGEDHPHVASALNNLAGLYNSQDKYEEAEPLYQRSLSIKEKMLGKDHPSVATSLNNLGMLNYNQGNFKETIDYLEQAIAILQQVFPNGHPDLDVMRRNLVDVLGLIGEDK